MKLFFILAIALCLNATAGIDIPRKAYSPSELEKAQAEAAESGKPLVFVYTCTSVG